MFGYVKPYVPEMKVSHYEKYRAVYCGLCRSMGKVTGQLSRLTLSYDFVFLAAVRMVLCGTDVEFESMRCFAHPLKKRLVMKDNDALDFTAAIAATLAWAKNKDDLADESGASKIKPILVSPLAEHINRRGGCALPENTAENTLAFLARLTELEKSKCSSSDEAASVFGEALGYVFSIGLEGERAEIARSIGYSVGKFIYMCDAADDMESDIKKNRYNPIYIGWGELALAEDGKMSSLVKESVMTAVPIELESLDDAIVQLEELEGEHIMLPIVKNIVYLGLPNTMRRILYGAEQDEKEEIL
ncbi:MAG: hypothetical protein E7672_05615 [Ruminococcaceae bacterium]|nr:hypothetical protein [Oscillospiraceae bacterium]